MTSTIARILMTGAPALAFVLPGAALATPQVLFSSGSTANGRLASGAPPAGPIEVQGGVTQLGLADGAVIAFVGDAGFSIDATGAVVVRAGNFTATAGTGGSLTVQTASGQEVRLTAPGTAASLAVGADGALTGRSLAGPLSIASGGQVRRFGAGQAFRAAANAAPAAAVTAGAQPVSATGTLIDQPTTLAQVLNNAALVPSLISGNAVPVQQNPALATFAAGTTAEMLAAYLAKAPDGISLAPSRAILAAQLAFLKAGGAAGALQGGSASSGLAAYVRYLQSGGAPASYANASTALLTSYLAYVRAAGLPAGLDDSTRQILDAYLTYLAAGGAFGTVPEVAVTPTPTPTPTPTTTLTVAAAPSGIFTGGPTDPGVLAIGVNGQGRPIDLGYYGAPGTATLTDYRTGDGWMLGRFAGGSFGSASNPRSYETNQGAHFALLTPVTNLPTSGGVLYTVAASTTPTFTAAGAPPVTASDVRINLGVQFGASPKFGYDGTLSVTADGQASSIAFSTLGGSASPALANVDNSNPRFGLYGTAPLTQASGSLCASASTCAFNANFIVGGPAAAAFGVGYSVVATPGGTSLLNGAAVLTRSGTIADQPAPVAVAFEDVVGVRATNQFLARVDPRNAITASTPVTTVRDDSGLSAYRENSTTAESPQRGTARGGESGSSDGVIFWSRWAGGVTAGEFNGAGPMTLSANQGWHFIYGSPATAIPAGGNASYALAGGTKPTIVDGSLAPGVLTGSAAVGFGSQARLGLDFTVTIGGVAYRSTTTGGVATPASSDITIGNTGAFEYFGAGLATSGTGAVCPNGTCRAGVIGALAGNGASHLGFDYLISEPTAVGLRTAVSGAAAFKRDATPAVVTPIGTGLAPSGTALSYSAQGHGFNRSAITAAVATSPDGQLASASTTSAEIFSKNTAAVSDFGGASGIVGWSRWSDGTLIAGNLAYTLSANQGVHSVWGTPLTNLPTSGSATYDLVGATKPTIGDGSAAPGSFTGALAVSFAAMKLGWESTIGFNGTNYVFNSAGGLAAPSVTLGSDGRWIGSSAAVNGLQGRAYGFLAGDGASHAGMTYLLPTVAGGSDAVTLTGAAAFQRR